MRTARASSAADRARGGASRPGRSATGSAPAGDAVEEVRVDRSRDLPVVAEYVLAHLVRDRSVALLAHHVQHRLGDDELRERAHDDGIAQIRTHAAGFVEDLLEAVIDAERRELGFQVRDHSARHLVVIVKGIVRGDFTNRLALCCCDEPQPVCDLLHHPEIDLDVEAGAPGIAHELLRRRVRCPVGQRGGRGVHRVRTVLDALHHHVGREPGEAVAGGSATAGRRTHASRLARG